MKIADFTNTQTLRKALLTPNWAILTATRETVGAARNHEANIRLHRVLVASGFQVAQVAGSYKGVDQGVSFLVLGMNARQAVAFGRYLGQESVLVPAGLLFTDLTLNPVKPDELVIGKRAEAKDFFSRVESGPAFSVGLDFSKKINLAKV